MHFNLGSVAAVLAVLLSSLAGVGRAQASTRDPQRTIHTALSVMQAGWLQNQRPQQEAQRQRGTWQPLLPDVAVQREHVGPGRPLRDQACAPRAP